MADESSKQTVGPRDRAVIAGELGREPHDLTGVAARCPYGYPAVIETAPVLTGGAPNPTLLYLTCPALATIVSRIENEGGVKALRAASQEEGPLRRLMQEMTRLYRERRTELAAGDANAILRTARLGAGIGGPEGPEVASCLHAYAAALLAVRTGWLASGPSGDPTLAAGAEEAWNRFLPPLEDSWCMDGKCSRWDTGERRAAIDVGTISVRLLVADIGEGRPETVVRRTEITRLGESLRPNGPLNEEALRRTATAVNRLVEEARRDGVDSIVLVGTSAAREALDGQVFIHDLGRQNDVPSFVLSGTREAELAHAGVSLDLEGDVVVLDVGGGSSELICRSESGTVSAVSLDLGASRATERWIRSDPPAADETAAIYREACGAFGALRQQFGAGAAGCAGALGTEVAARLLAGVAGTVTTLACLDAGLEAYDSDLIHLRTLSVDAVRDLVARLSALTTAERASLPCVQVGRAPVIVGGAVIVLAAMETLGYETLTVSEHDLLDGLVMLGA